MRNNLKKRKFLLRLFSLLFSFFIWLYVISSAEVVVQKILPVQIELVDGYSLSKLVDNDISLKIKGPRVFVRKYLDSKDRFILQLQDYYKEGTNNYRVRVNQFKFSLPFGIELLEFSPKYIEFSIGKTVKKVLPIIVKVDPKIKQKYEIKNLNVSPKEIEVTGARQLLRGVDSVETKFLDEKLLSGEEIEIEIEKTNKFIHYGQEIAVVSYNLDSRVSEFTFTNIPIIFQSEKLLSTASPKTVSVKVRGLKSQLNEKLKSSIKIYAKIPPSDSKKLDITLSGELPDKIELIEIQPKQIAVVTE